MGSTDRFEIHDLLRKRWSPVAFDSRAVESYKIRNLFEAARWAPSSRNEQPWSFIFAEKGDPGFDKMVDTLAAGNRVWATNAPLLVLSIAKVISQYNGKENYYAMHDTGMAVANLLVQATEMGLLAHQMGGYDKQMARELFGIPRDYQPVAMIAIGYRGDPSILQDELQKREKAERSRRPLPEFVFRNRWSDAPGLSESGG